MRFALGWTGVLLGSALLLGCSVGDTAGVFHPDHESDGTETKVNAALVFEEAASVELVPGETRPITISTSPPAAYEIYFALSGAPSDASLDAGHLFTGADGRATVNLHAPSTPAAFTLRAWIKNGPTAELPVSVTKQGVATIEVVPQYDGQRPVEEWVASVIAGTTCDALVGQLPGEPKGAFVSTAPSASSPLIQSVPVGPKLAVTVRAGHYAWGCADAHDVSSTGVTKVKVHVVDVPLALERTSLDLKLVYAPEAQPYGKLLGQARGALLDAFLPPGAGQAAALLDAMGAAAYEPISFALAREVGGWDAIASAHFEQLATPLRQQMETWLDLGFAAAAPQLTGRLEAIVGVPGKALFLADSIGGLDAKSAGAPAEHLVSWTSAPNDKVFLSGVIYWMPSRLAGAACRAGAESDLGAIDGMSDALAQAAACTDLAAAFGSSEACDGWCLAELCREALGARWQAALDASAADQTVGTITIGASAVAQVDDIATPIGVSGTWLGTVSDGTTSALASGEAGGVLAGSGDENPGDPGGDPPQ